MRNPEGYQSQQPPTVRERARETLHRAVKPLSRLAAASTLALTAACDRGPEIYPVDKAQLTEAGMFWPAEATVSDTCVMQDAQGEQVEIDLRDQTSDGITCLGGFDLESAGDEQIPAEQVSFMKKTDGTVIVGVNATDGTYHEISPETAGIGLGDNDIVDASGDQFSIEFAALEGNAVQNPVQVATPDRNRLVLSGGATSTPGGPKQPDPNQPTLAPRPTDMPTPPAGTPGATSVVATAELPPSEAGVDGCIDSFGQPYRKGESSPSGNWTCLGFVAADPNGNRYYNFTENHGEAVTFWYVIVQRDGNRIVNQGKVEATGTGIWISAGPSTNQPTPSSK